MKKTICELPFTKGIVLSYFVGNRSIAPHTPAWYENPLFCSSSTNFQCPAYQAQFDLIELQNLRNWKTKIKQSIADSQISTFGNVKL